MPWSASSARLRSASACAEKDPATCHRSLLVAYPLLRQSQIDVLHILHTGELESQQQLEERLVKVHQLDNDLFMSEQEKQHHAYELQHDQYAYIRPEAPIN